MLSGTPSGIGLAQTIVELHRGVTTGLDVSCGIIGKIVNSETGRGHKHGKFLGLLRGFSTDRWAPGSHRRQPALLRHRATPERFPVVTAPCLAQYARHEVFAGPVALIRPIQMTPNSAG
jgi:hypothetical protein